MGFLNWFVISVFFGAASASLWDLWPKYELCYQSVAGPSKICNHLDDMLNCLNKAAKEENVELIKEVTDVTDSYIKVCQSGTEENRLYESKNDCLVSAANGEALKEYISCVQKLPIDVKANRFQQVCKFIDELEKCSPKPTQCGEEGLRLHDILYGVRFSLIRKTCQEKN